MGDPLPAPIESGCFGDTHSVTRASPPPGPWVGGSFSSLAISIGQDPGRIGLSS